MKKGLFVTNLPHNLKSGGWSGMNINVFEQLQKHFDMEYMSSINPSVNRSEQIFSKVKSIFTKKRDFEFFSERRLTSISKLFDERSSGTHDFIFFHGTTPWVKCNCKQPYFAYVDATFLTYLDIYLSASSFSSKEIDRIMYQERKFLEKASKIFFSSDWARLETINRYGVDGSNFYTVGLGGNSKVPDNIAFNKNQNLLFVSMDFYRKGGMIAFEAFKKVKNKFPETKLQIIGAAPPKDVISTDGVIYHGFIDKKTEEGKIKFDTIFRDSTVLIHPTEKDMTPLIVIEAGYYGIPAIAPARFGIPEMIIDNETGFLVDNHKDSQEISQKIKKLIVNLDLYEEMCKNARNNSITKFTWDKVGERIGKEIEFRL